MGRFWTPSRLSKKQAYANISDRSDVMAPSPPSSPDRNNSAFLPVMDSSSRHSSATEPFAAQQKLLFQESAPSKASLSPTFVDSPAKVSPPSAAVASPTSTLSPDFLRKSNHSCDTSPASQPAPHGKSRQQPRLRPSQMPLFYSVQIIDKAFFPNACLYRDVLHVPPLTATNHQIRAAYFRRGREVLATPNLDDANDDDMTTMSFGVDDDSSVTTMMSIRSGVPVSRKAKMKFHAISIAYEILHDVVLRREYDFEWRLLHPPAIPMCDEKHEERISRGDLNDMIRECAAPEPTDKYAIRDDYEHVNVKRTSSTASTCSHSSHTSILRNRRAYPRSSSTNSSVVRRRSFVTWNEQVEELVITDYDPNEHFPISEPVDDIRDDDSSEYTTESDDDESESADSLQDSSSQDFLSDVDDESEIDFFEQLETNDFAKIPLRKGQHRTTQRPGDESEIDFFEQLETNDFAKIPLRKGQHRTTQRPGDEKQKRTKKNWLSGQINGKIKIQREIANNPPQQMRCTDNSYLAAWDGVYGGQQKELKTQLRRWGEYSDNETVASIDGSSVGTSDYGCGFSITSNNFFRGTSVTGSSRKGSQWSDREVEGFSLLKSKKSGKLEQYIRSGSTTEKASKNTVGVEKYQRKLDSLFQPSLEKEWRHAQQDRLKRIGLPESLNNQDIVTVTQSDSVFIGQEKTASQRKVDNPQLTIESAACFPQSSDLAFGFHIYLGKFIQAAVDDIKDRMNSFGNVLNGCDTGATKHIEVENSKAAFSGSEKEANADGFLLMNSELDALMSLFERDVDEFVFSKCFANQHTFRTNDNRGDVRNKPRKKSVKKIN